MKLKFTTWQWLVVYGVFIYLFFLVTTLPAKVAWSLLPEDIQRSVVFSNLQGSAWSSRAENISVSGLALGQAEWSINPLYLFIGDLAGHINLRQALGQLESDFSITADQVIELSSLNAELSAAAFDPHIRPFMLEGIMSGQLESLQFQENVVLEATGTLHWRDASITGVQDVSLGDLTFNANPEAKGTRLQVSNEGGLIAVSGDIRLAGNGRYNLNLLLSSRESGNKDLKSILAVLGRADAQGRVRFTQTGKLPGW